MDNNGNLRLFDLDNKNKTYDKLDDVVDLLNKLSDENKQLKHELLCKQLDKAPTEPINCKCHYEVKK